MTGPSRLAQPYRKGARQPGMALTAMLRGRAANGANPADTTRAAQMIASAYQRRGRAPRGPRGPRTPR